MKDSRQIDEKDRREMLRLIRKATDRLFIITHGTYTMPDTARYLKAKLSDTDKTVVLTGSITPLIGFSPSDAAFNLGYSMAQVRVLPSGIYVCMHGQTFTADEVAKDMAMARFYSVLGEK
jgi:L-asparaginase